MGQRRFDARVHPQSRNVSANPGTGKLKYVSKQQIIVEQIHGSGKQLVLAVTGGGSGAICALLQVPGASASVLEAVVPYSATALIGWLGGRPDQFCSERTARAMAMAAFERARKLSNVDPHILRGVGATASLASNRLKRGEHRIHVAWQSAETTTAISLVLTGEHSRAAEEEISTDLILAAVAEACGIEDGKLNDPFRDSAERRTEHAPREWTELLLGARRSVLAGTPDVGSPTKLLFPGAFNPPHAGHKRMAQIAAERLATPVTYELSITNVDKPPLDFIEISDRLSNLKNEPVLLTRAPTFVEKAELVPGCVFIVGTDTLLRIGDQVYYDGDAA